MWDVDDGVCEGWLPGARGAAVCALAVAAVGPDGAPVVLAGCRTGEALAWWAPASRRDWRDWGSWPPARRLGAHLRAVLCVEMSGLWAATGSSDCTIAVWDLPTAAASAAAAGGGGEALITTLRGHGGPVLALAAAAAAAVGPGSLVSASADQTLRLWSLSTFWYVSGACSACFANGYY